MTSIFSQMFGSNDPKNDSKYHWTNHVKDKMRYYHISESLIKRIVRFPKRMEEGIAPGTVAVMQSRESISRAGGKIKKKTEEIWVMYVDSKKGEDREKNILIPSKKKIITAWRYPGTSPIRAQIPIPDDILIELENSSLLVGDTD